MFMETFRRLLLTFVAGVCLFRSCRETQNEAFRASAAKKRSWPFWEAFGLLVSVSTVAGGLELVPRLGNDYFVQNANTPFLQAPAPREGCCSICA